MFIYKKPNILIFFTLYGNRHDVFFQVLVCHLVLLLCQPSTLPCASVINHMQGMHRYIKRGSAEFKEKQGNYGRNKCLNSSLAKTRMDDFRWIQKSRSDYPSYLPDVVPARESALSFFKL